MDIGPTVANMNDQLYTATRTKTSTITQNSSSHHNAGTISDPISIASPVSPSNAKMSQQGYQSTGLPGSMSTGISTGFTTSLSTPNNFDTIVSQSYSDAENYIPSTTPVLYNSLSIQGEATMFPHNNDTNLLSTQRHFLPPPPKSRVRKRAPVPEIINPTPLKQGRMEGLASEVPALKIEIQGLKTEIQGLSNQLELMKATSNKNTEDILQALEDHTNYQFELFSALTTNVNTEQKRNLLEVLRGAMLKLESDSPSTPKA
ncbi:MAG: hypothetical protein ABW185_25430 [Sedimenticola sp.]